MSHAFGVEIPLLPQVYYFHYTMKAALLICYEDSRLFQQEGMSKLVETIMGSWTIILSSH